MTESRWLFTEHQLYYLLPALLGLAVVVVRGLALRTPARLIVLQLLVVACVAGELRIGLGSKTLLIGFEELMLPVLLAAAWNERRDRLVLVPRAYLIIMGLLCVVVTASTLVYTTALARSLRGLLLLYEEVLVPVAVVLLLDPEDQPLEVGFQVLWIAGLVLLASGVLLTVDAYGFEPRYWSTNRVFGAPVGLNNTVAGVAALLFVVAAGLAYLEHPRYLVPVMLFGAVILLANSRNGTGTAALGLLVVFLVGKKSGSSKAAWLGLVIVVVTGLVASGVLRAQVERLLFRSDLSDHQDFWGGRLLTWGLALQHFARSPIIGVGLYTVYDDEFTGMSGFMAHNLFLQELMTGGIVGLALRLGAIGYVLRQAYRLARRADSAVAASIFAALVAAFFFGQLEPLYYTNHQGFVVTLLAGLTFALARRAPAASPAPEAEAEAQDEPAPEPAEPAPNGAPRLGGVGESAAGPSR